ncbi:MAG: hypothetical protein IPH12_00065 [Saprospirales bacterium]|jgi:hypothetical protein|nr:hypothetical protein [Saprospirales bacterium]MBK8923978.1 hypothetical protein [Saprospirales bacterium]
MKYTNRSLWFAVLACVAMGFFARSPRFAQGSAFITIALFLATLLLSGAGFWWGLRGVRQQRQAWPWLAPAINAFIFIAFLAFFLLILRALARLQ